MLRYSLLVLLAPLLAGLAIPASGQQPVCVRGLVERAGPSVCPSDPGTHQFRCAGLWLEPAAAVDLRSHEGRVVEACGTIRISGGCRTLDVTSLRTPVDHLRISGRFALGERIDFDLGQTPASLYAVLLAGRMDWVDLGPTGVLLLGTPWIHFASGILPGSGQDSFQVTIPNDPALLGGSFHFQAAFVDLQSRQAAMANADCFRIQ